MSKKADGTAEFTDTDAVPTPAVTGSVNVYGDLLNLNSSEAKNEKIRAAYEKPTLGKKVDLMET